MAIIKKIIDKIYNIIKWIISEENSDFWISLVKHRERVVNYTMHVKTPNFVPQYGEIYDIDLGINIWSELQKTRPCIHSINEILYQLYLSPRSKNTKRLVSYHQQYIKMIKII